MSVSELAFAVLLLKTRLLALNKLDDFCVVEVHFDLWELHMLRLSELGHVQIVVVYVRAELDTCRLPLLDVLARDLGHGFPEPPPDECMDTVVADLVEPPRGSRLQSYHDLGFLDRTAALDQSLTANDD